MQSQCHADKMLEYVVAPCLSEPTLSWFTEQPLGQMPSKSFSTFVMDKVNRAVISDSLLRTTTTRSQQDVDMYAAFVDASNAVLACLRDLKIEGMRDPLSKRSACFSSETIRRFYLTAMPKSCYVAPRTLSSFLTIIDPTTGMGMHRTTPGRLPCRTCGRTCFSVIEFSRSGMVAPPPEIYCVTEYKATEPEYFAIGPDGADANIVVDLRRHRRTFLLPAKQNPNKIQPRQSWIRFETIIALTALYSAEMFSANFAVKHVLNITVRDDVIWMWYYDRQGIISVGGINFVQDLPRYLAIAELKLDWDSRDRLTQFTLKERATNVIPVTCEQLDIERPNETKDGMVAKVYWGEEERASEPDILEHVARVAKENKDVEGHVPFLLLSHKFAGPTSIVKECAGPRRRCQRQSGWLYPGISSLWALDSRRPITMMSAAHNLMYYRIRRQADKVGEDRKCNTYIRHDLESLIWVFIWISFQYKDGVFRSPKGPLHEWVEGNDHKCAVEKGWFLTDGKGPDDIDLTVQYRVLTLVIFLARLVDARYNRKWGLRRARTHLADLEARQPKLHPTPASPSRRIKELQEEIQRLEAEPLEEPDEVVFQRFEKSTFGEGAKIVLDHSTIPAVVRMRALWTTTTYDI
ncbi:hypothetical protein BU15DRAFT_59005 [Melanogaster broomeanus]|nr:hypothetical protein BU15DRAFT_59005 [Melanogaster broomeanus]